MNYYSNNYLMHHGIKGMKWGVRKDRKSSSDTDDSRNPKRKGLSDRTKKALLIGAAVAGTVAVGAIAYKVAKDRAKERDIDIQRFIDFHTTAKSARYGEIMAMRQLGAKEEYFKRPNLYKGMQFAYDNHKTTSDALAKRVGGDFRVNYQHPDFGYPHSSYETPSAKAAHKYAANIYSQKARESLANWNANRYKYRKYIRDL